MPSEVELATVADASVFILLGSIARPHQSGDPAERATALMRVERAIKVPPGLRGLAGRDVTVRLRHPLPDGRYVFFADPVTIGDGVVINEREHLSDHEVALAEAAMARGYAARIADRCAVAFLVALGTVGEVRPLLPPEERRGRVPWAIAPFNVEHVIKGKKPKQVLLVGPLHASKRLPRAPALRSGLHAILILQRPPKDALELVPEFRTPVDRLHC